MPRQNKLQEFSQFEKPGDSGNPVFLAVGRLLRPHGLTGEILMEIYTDFPERLRPGRKVFIGEKHEPLQIRSRRGALNGFLIGFEAINNPEEAGILRNQIVYIRTEEIPPLPEGEYYHHQVLGLRVITDEGTELGSIASILETGSTDVYVIKPAEGKEILIPNIGSVVKEINLEKGEMHIHVLEGLLPD